MSEGRIGYRELAARLREKINDGTYPPGSTIPTLEDLMEQFGATSATVRQAVKTLRAEGLVTPMGRRGTVVRDRSRVTLPFRRYTNALAPAPAPEGNRGPWESACAAQGVDGRTETILVDQRPAPDDVAYALDLPEGAPVVYRLRHMYAGAQVAQVSESYLPLALVEGSPLAGTGKVVGGVYRALTALGHPPATATQRITGRMPTPEEAEALSLDIGSPVLTLMGVTRGPDGTPLEVTRLTVAGDRVELLYEDLPLRR